MKNRIYRDSPSVTLRTIVFFYFFILTQDLFYFKLYHEEQCFVFLLLQGKNESTSLAFCRSAYRNSFFICRKHCAHGWTQTGKLNFYGIKKTMCSLHDCLNCFERKILLQHPSKWHSIQLVLWFKTEIAVTISGIPLIDWRCFFLKIYFWHFFACITVGQFRTEEAKRETLEAISTVIKMLFLAGL